MSKYNELPFQYFGFDVFEEILARINERRSVTEDPAFNAGITSAEGAVQRLREEYYEAIKSKLE